jgi:hypothetical protein
MAKKAHIPMPYIGASALFVQLAWGSLNAYFGSVPGNAKISINRNKEAPKGKNKATIPTLALRGIFVSVAVFVSLMLSTIDGVAAGLASMFPGFNKNCF